MPMKTPLLLRLGVAALLAAGQLTLAAQGVPKLISQPTPLPVASQPKETAEARAARQAAELKEAEAAITALAKDFPLLTGPGWEEHFGKFRAELKVVQARPEFRGKAPALPRPAPGRPPQPPNVAQMHLARREAALATMRAQADKVLETRPELRAYVEQQFQWHKRLFAVQDRYPGNAKVHQLVQNRLEVPVPPAQR